MKLEGAGTLPNSFNTCRRIQLAWKSRTPTNTTLRMFAVRNGINREGNQPGMSLEEDASIEVALFTMPVHVQIVYDDRDTSPVG